MSLQSKGPTGAAPAKPPLGLILPGICCGMGEGLILDCSNPNFGLSHLSRPFMQTLANESPGSWPWCCLNLCGHRRLPLPWPPNLCREFYKERLWPVFFLLPLRESSSISFPPPPALGLLGAEQVFGDHLILLVIQWRSGLKVSQGLPAAGDQRSGSTDNGSLVSLLLNQVTQSKRWQFWGGDVLQIFSSFTLSVTVMDSSLTKYT